MSAASSQGCSDVPTPTQHPWQPEDSPLGLSLPSPSGGGATDDALGDAAGDALGDALGDADDGTKAVLDALGAGSPAEEDLDPSGPVALIDGAGGGVGWLFATQIPPGSDGLGFSACQPGGQTGIARAVAVTPRMVAPSRMTGPRALTDIGEPCSNSCYAASHRNGRLGARAPLG